MNEANPSGIANRPIGDANADNANQVIGGTDADNAGTAHLPPGNIDGHNVTSPIGNGTDAGRAHQEMGDPDVGASYWYSRGYLPHLECPEKIQHVTFHLADSLPKAVLERWAAELKHWPPDRQAVEQRQRVQAYLDAGHGSCILLETEIAAMVQNSLLYFAEQRYHLYAWVVMPNHVHVLFQALNGWTMAKIIASWKKFTARKICDYRRARTAGTANRAIGVVANQAIGDPGSPVWHQEYWDRYMRDDRHFRQAVEYIHQNPVMAGLVATAETWLWSSAYSGNAGSAGSADLLIGNGNGNGDADNANQAIGDPKGQS